MQGTPQAAERVISKVFQFPGDLDSVTAGRENIMEFVRPHCSSEAEEIDIFLALQEALVNAALHGCSNHPDKAIRCTVSVDPSAFNFTIRDPGAGFDPDSATRHPESGANNSDHGRGIFLMRSLMDEVTYSHGGSEVHLRKWRRSPQPRTV